MQKLSETGTLYRDAVIHSYSMVFFNLRRWFAVAVLLLTFIDPVAGAAGLLSVLLANGLAIGMGFNQQLIRNGDLGFNALLVGLGLGAYYEWGAPLFILLLLAAVVTLIITVVTMGILSKYQLPFLSLPFVLSLWTLMLASTQFEALGVSQRGLYLLNELYAVGDHLLVEAYHALNAIDIPMAVKTYLRSLGAILFQYNLLTGLILAFLLLLYSRMAFLLSLLGYFTAYLFYEFIGADLNQFNYSYIGFNFILSAIAVGGFFLVPSRSSYLWALLLIPVLSILSSSLAQLMATLRLSLYALPFNLIVLSFLYVLKWRDVREHPREVSYQRFWPEANYYHDRSGRARFRHYRPAAVRLPVIGEWYVSQGRNGDITHREAWRHAWDLVIHDAEGKEYRGAGREPGDYYCYGLPVVAPAAGTVVEVIDHIPDNAIGETNLIRNWGNSLVIDHGYGLYSQLSHLKAGSFQVAAGAHVHQGQILAQCGNSGRSPTPHLHFQLQQSPRVGAPTLDYSLAMYLSRRPPDETAFHFYGFPQEGALVQNMQADALFRQAFYFVPGKRLHFRVDDTETVTWECRTDAYNHQYIEHEASGARAYFQNNGLLIYFTDYRGPHDNLLYHFFRAHYLVGFTFRPELQLDDRFPLHLIDRSPLRWLQDLTAPFLGFLQATYHLRYAEGAGSPELKTVRLRSEVRQRRFGSEQTAARYETLLKNDRIDRFEIRTAGGQTVAIWIDEANISTSTAYQPS